MAGSPTGAYPDESRRESVSDRFTHKLVVICGGPDGGVILLCIRSSDGKKGSFDVKGQPYAS